MESKKFIQYARTMFYKFINFSYYRLTSIKIFNAIIHKKIFFYYYRKDEEKGEAGGWRVEGRLRFRKSKN